MIRLANKKDIHPIMEIIKESILEMNSYGNVQWSSDYPAEKDFLNDIEKKELFVYEEEKGNKICGIICVNFVEPEEYKHINWSLDKKALVLHRMAIAVSERQKGIGTALMNFAQQYAQEKNVDYLKTDTYSINDKMIHLFEKCDYKKKGTMHFKGREKLFYCYEKILGV